MFRNRQINSRKSLLFAIKSWQTVTETRKYFSLFGLNLKPKDGRLAAQLTRGEKPGAAEAPQAENTEQGGLINQVYWQLNKLAQMKRSYNLIT